MSEGYSGKTDRLIKRIISIALGAIILAAVFFSGYYTYYLTMDKELKEFKWFLDSVKKYYYEDITAEDILNTALSAVSRELLDAYSTYYTEEEYQIIQSQRQGNRVGVGLSFLTENGVNTNKVFMVNGNSPAEKAGLKKGDAVTAIGASADSLVATSNYAEVSAQLAKFNDGAEICMRLFDGESYRTATIQRRQYLEGYVYYADSDKSYGFFSGESGVLSFTAVPDGVKTLSYGEFSGLPQDTAYIKLNSFNGRAAEQFGLAMAQFKTDGKSKLILDLRGNGGGYLDILQNICAYLVYKDGVKLSATKVKRKDGSVTDYPIYESYYKNYSIADIAVLADNNSASASECLIGAMLDYGTVKPENVIVTKFTSGEKTIDTTYGKGIMQQTYTKNFGSGSAIKLTVATVHWPVSDTCIHGTGISGTAVETSNGSVLDGKFDKQLEEASRRLSS